MNSSPIKLILALLMLLLPASAATADDAEEDSHLHPAAARHELIRQAVAPLPQALGCAHTHRNPRSVCPATWAPSPWAWGWDYGSRRQWETYLLFGFIPKCSSSRPKMTMTLKQNYMCHGTFRWAMASSLSRSPRECISTRSSDGSSGPRSPPNIRAGYYKFATKIRANIFAGERFTRSLDKDNIPRCEGRVPVL